MEVPPKRKVYSQSYRTEWETYIEFTPVSAPPRGAVCNGKPVDITRREKPNHTAGEMIQVVLVFTESGDLRFFKFYDEMPHPRRLVLREQLIARVHRRRERGVSGETFDCADLLGEESFGVYRQAGSLTVLFGADGGESPLFILDLIDAFVHALRSHFGQSDRQVEQAFATRLNEVSGLLDEMVQGGLVLETDPHEAVRHLRAQLNSGSSQQASPVKSLLSGLSKKLSK